MGTTSRRPSTLEATALHMGVSVSWLEREVESGRLPCVRFAGRIWLDPEAVQRARLQGILRRLKSSASNMENSNGR